MHRTLLPFLLLFAVLAVVVLWLSRGQEATLSPAAATVVSLLGSGDTSGFRRAERPGGIEWPRDHGAHDDYRSEWWYFTGNLATDSGREFGFQLTFFRFALAPPITRESDWAANQVYMAHFAITDKANDDHRVTERFARRATGLAGVTTAPFEVWLDDWSAASAANAFLPMELSAADGAAGISLALTLAPGKPPVLQGEAGLSAKGREPGNASWYYSYTRLPAMGVLEVDGRPFDVSGFAWLDREWSTSSLDADVVGWDWFALQLEDGRDVMLYSLRREDGSPAPQSAGSIVAIDGRRQALDHTDYSLSPVRQWRSPHSGISWPVVWRARVPGQRLDLELRAVPVDQEQNLTVRYWEGSIDVLDAEDGTRVGRGYMELTGYRPPPANSPR